MAAISLTPLPDIPNPYLELLGVSLLNLGQGHAEFAMEIGPQHLNKHGQLHGGLIASLLDVACGYAGLIADDGAHVDSITLSLTVSYLATTNRGGLRATGEIIGAGRTIYFAQASLIDEDGKLLAQATGTFKRGAGAGRPLAGAATAKIG